MANEELNEEVQSPADDPQAADPQTAETQAAEDDAESSSATDEPTIESLQQQLADADKRVLQAEAEKENFRKRIKADFETQLRFAALPLVQDILQVRDNLKRALEAAGENESLREGVAMVAKQLDDNLAKHHCKPIPAVGEVFDPNFHEAIQQAPSDQYAAGIVSMEVTTGYQLYERVVRPSQVIVSTGPANS